EQGVEQRPVADGVGAVEEALRLAQRLADAAHVQVVPREGYGAAQATLRHRALDHARQTRALPVRQPGDAGREALVPEVPPGHGDPALDHLVLGERVEDHLVDRVDVALVARHGDPPERAEAAAEEGPDVAGDEHGDLEGVLDAALGRLRPDVVAVLEGHGPGALPGEHRAHVLDDGRPGALLEALRVGLAQLAPRLEVHAHGHVALPQVVGAGLVGDDVGPHAHLREPREDRRGVAQQPYRQRLARPPRLLRPRHGLLDARRAPLEVAGPQPPLDAPLVDLDADPDAAGHGYRQGLGAAHAPQAGGDDETAAQAPAEVLLGDRGEGLVRALHDPLGADVLPVARRVAAP